MANHKSAIKEHRQALQARDRNRYNRARLRSALKKCRQAIESGDTGTATALLTPTLGLLDRTAKLGAIHPNAADRSKSRLQRAFNKLQA